MAIVRKYNAETINVINPVDSIYVVEFRSTEKPFNYYPGQFLHLSLDEYDPSSAWPISRCFSMQTPPENSTIKITFAVKGEYTARMASELKPGKVVSLKLPYGELFAEKSFNNCIFIAGGTGITPFLSLFTSTEFCNYINPKLYFGLRSTKYNIYEEILTKAISLNNNFTVKLIYEDIQGKINIEDIFKENGTDAVYFISGPPLMISTFRKYLQSKNVTEANIKTDEWE